MALLELKDIGKIYASEGAVAVGIRGVNLAFDKGEFVAVTGKSGSGKSTLLNVISGIDSYEEGELLIEGSPTSHYGQPDWEEYRSKYISFIFQDYNIIESFTVLQNVELALTEIENLKERRKRAIELLTRVGMEKFLNHKGSKLSGGQKQRTVIARALAKDSPIILADEPTGNLDSQTSREILDLMKEVSQDKLLIIVTHDFEEVKDEATRHIRIFDGTVESDQVLKPNTIIPTTISKNEEEAEEKVVKKKKIKKTLRNGFALGKTLYSSRPKLSIFLCLLLLLGSVGMFFSVVNSTDADSLFTTTTMFQEEEGRVVMVKKDGTVFSDGELENLKAKYGAQKIVHYDYLNDYVNNNNISAFFYSSKGFNLYIYDYYHNIYYDAYLKATTESIDSDNLIGRQPEAINEVLLYLPISVKPAVGEDSIAKDYQTVELAGLEFTVVGVSYYTDNTKTPLVRVTDEGYKLLTVFAYYGGSWDNLAPGYFYGEVDYLPYSKDGVVKSVPAEVCYSFTLGNKIYWDQLNKTATAARNAILSDGENPDDAQFRQYLYPVNISFFNKEYSDVDFSFDYENVDEWLATDCEDAYGGSSYYSGYDTIVVGVEVIENIFFEKMQSEYTQASIYFASNKEATKMAEKMMADDANLIAVPSNTTYKPSLLTMIESTIVAVFALIELLVIVVFLAFFINLATSKTVGALRSDMAIMRSMGISVKEIRVSMYIRMLFCLIPSYIAVILVAIAIYTIPTLNMLFTYIAWWKYLVIFAGVTLIALRVTRLQLKKLFNVSVKKALRGDENA